MDDIRDMRDEELMLLCAQGDLEAFNTLFHRYQKKILNFAWLYLNDRDSAEDILQGTFLRMFIFARTFKKKAAFSNWLYTIARNLCWEESQRSRRRIQVHNEELDVPDCQQPDPLEEAEHRELQERIREAIGLLPPRQRSAIILSKYQGMSISETAGILGCSAGAVKQLTHRGLLSLRKKLAPYTED